MWRKVEAIFGLINDASHMTRRALYSTVDPEKSVHNATIFFEPFFCCYILIYKKYIYTLYRSAAAVGTL